MNLVAIDLVLAVVAMVWLASGLHVVGERERLALVRLGRYIGIRGPGLVFAMPGIDKAVRVQLDRDIPEWRALSAEQLSERIRQRVGGG